MPLELQEKADGKVLVVRASGKLGKANYERFVPEVERLIGLQGKIRILFDLRDFHGWTVGGAWEDFKFGVHHFRDIERLALVGDKAWEHAMATFCRPFTTAKIHYFDHSEDDQAEEWIQQDLPVAHQRYASASKHCLVELWQSQSASEATIGETDISA